MTACRGCGQTILEAEGRATGLEFLGAVAERVAAEKGGGPLCRQCRERKRWRGAAALDMLDDEAL